jgi:hypothetical protein
MSGFAKQASCPASATLAAYHAGTLSFLARRSVAEHLPACEFCGAEAAFWFSFNPHADGAGAMPETCVVALEAATPPMPLALRGLAESLLGEMNAVAAQTTERRAA